MSPMSGMRHYLHAATTPLATARRPTAPDLSLASAHSRLGPLARPLHLRHGPGTDEAQPRPPAAPGQRGDLGHAPPHFQAAPAGRPDPDPGRPVPPDAG